MRKKFWLRGIALLLSLLILCPLLTGCGEQTIKETNEFSVYNLINSKIPMKSSGFYEYVISEYASRYPDVSLDYRTSDLDYVALIWGDGITDEIGDALQEYYDSISIDIMKGNCKDIIYADTFYQWFYDVTPPDYNKMICAGAFIDLKPLLSEIAPELDLSVYDSLLIDGKLYAIPFYRQPYTIASAEKMLDKWGFNFDANDDILTFLRKCAAWQEEHSYDNDAPVVFTKQAWDYIYYNIFNIIGTDVIDYENRTANFDAPKVREVIELLYQLKSDYEEPTGNAVDHGNETLIYDKALFGHPDGTYSTLMMAAHGYNYLNDPALIMPLRQMDGNVATGSYTYFMIPENAKNKYNAARYIALVQESVISIQKHERKVSGNRYAWNYLYSFDIKPDEFENLISNHIQLNYASDHVADTVRNMYHNQGDICMPSYWYHNLKHLFDDYMNGEMSIDELMTDVQDRLQIYVSE